MAAKPMMKPMKSMMKRLAGALVAAAALAGAASAQVGGGVVYPGTQPDTLLVIVNQHDTALQYMNCFANSNAVGDFFGTGATSEFYAWAEYFLNGGLVSGPQTAAADSQICFMRTGASGARARIIGAEVSHGYQPLASLALNAGGSGYNVNDTITLAGGTYSTPAVLTATACTASCPGAISTFTISNAGQYINGSASLTQAATSGSGTGATFKTATYGVVSPNAVSALNAFTGANAATLTWTEDGATYTTGTIDLGTGSGSSCGGGGCTSLTAMATAVSTAVNTAIHSATVAGQYGAIFNGTLTPGSCPGITGYEVFGFFIATAVTSNCLVVGGNIGQGPSNPPTNSGAGYGWGTLMSQVSGTPGGVGVYTIPWSGPVAPMVCGTIAQGTSCTEYWGVLTVASSPTPTGTISSGAGLYDGNPNVNLSLSGFNGLTNGTNPSSCTGAPCEGTQWVITCALQCAQGNFSLTGLIATAGGSGYAVGDTIVLSPSSAVATQAAVARVATVSSGAVTGVAFTGAGTVAQAFPGNFNSAPGTQTFSQASTSGSGTGAAFSVEKDLTAATVASGGAGCTTGTQTFTLSGGTETTAATVSGAVSSGALSGTLTVVNAGVYAASALPGNPVTLTGGGCSTPPTITATWAGISWSSTNGNGNAGGIAAETMYAETCRLQVSDGTIQGVTYDQDKFWLETALGCNTGNPEHSLSWMTSMPSNFATVWGWASNSTGLAGYTGTHTGPLYSQRSELIGSGETGYFAPNWTAWLTYTFGNVWGANLASNIQFAQDPDFGCIAPTCEVGYTPAYKNQISAWFATQPRFNYGRVFTDTAYPQANYSLNTPYGLPACVPNTQVFTPSGNSTLTANWNADYCPLHDYVFLGAGGPSSVAGISGTNGFPGAPGGSGGIVQIMGLTTDSGTLGQQVQVGATTGITTAANATRINSWSILGSGTMAAYSAGSATAPSGSTAASGGSAGGSTCTGVFNSPITNSIMGTTSLVYCKNGSTGSAGSNIAGDGGPGGSSSATLASNGHLGAESTGATGAGGGGGAGTSASPSNNTTLNGGTGGVNLDGTAPGGGGTGGATTISGTAPSGGGGGTQTAGVNGAVGAVGHTDTNFATGMTNCNAATLAGYGPGGGGGGGGGVKVSSSTASAGAGGAAGGYGASGGAPGGNNSASGGASPPAGASTNGLLIICGYQDH